MLALYESVDSEIRPGAGCQAGQGKISPLPRLHAVRRGLALATWRLSFDSGQLARHSSTRVSANFGADGSNPDDSPGVTGVNLCRPGHDGHEQLAAMPGS